MDAKTIAASIRSQLKAEGINGRCRVAPGAKDCIQVISRSFDTPFTDDEKTTIQRIAKDHGLTHAFGYPIVVGEVCPGDQVDYFMHATYKRGLRRSA